MADDRNRIGHRPSVIDHRLPNREHQRELADILGCRHGHPMGVLPHRRREKGTQGGKRDITEVRRGKVLVFSGCNSHPATGSLQPVAIGAAVEVAKPSEPSRQMCRFGDAASRQAVTRVNVEQASKRPMWSPTLLQYGEGRRRWG